MKKLLSTLFALIMVMCLLPTIVFASGEMHIYGELEAEDSNWSSSGYYVTFDISVENADAFSIMYLNLDLPTGFTIVSVTTGASLAAFDEVSDFGGGTTYAYTTEFAADYNNIKAKASNKEYTPEDGVILTVYILVDTDNVTNGTYPIEITQTSNQQGNIANLDAQAVPCTFTAGSIVVTNGQTATTEEESTTEFTDDYALEVQIDDGNYNVGDEITANIVAIAETATEAAEVFGSFDLTLSYDDDNLILDSFESTYGGTYNEGSLSAVISNGFNVPTDGVTIATATFTVNSDITEGYTASTIDLSTSYINKKATNVEIAWATTPADVDLYNLTVEFNDGANTENATGTTYVKYDTSTLYTSNDYTSEADLTTVTAKDSYRLADVAERWLNEADETNYYASTDTFTANATYSAQTVQQIVVTLGDVENGTWDNSETSVIVDYGTKLSDVTGLDVIPTDDNYSFGSYYVSDATISDDYEITTAITLDATCVANSFAFTTPTVANGSISFKTGLTTEDSKTTYGEDLEFTVTPNSGYVVTSVSYTVGTDGSSTTLPADSTDDSSYAKTYTIDGNEIKGVITITVETSAYVTITFKDVVGTKLNTYDDDVVLYAIYNTSALFADPADYGTTSSVPTVTADDNYRLDGVTADGTGNHLWSVGEITATASAIETTKFKEATTYTAQAIEQFTVTFKAGDNGDFTTTTMTVDDGYELAETDYPTPTPATGYQFDEWDVAAGTEIEANTTITASFKLGTYTITDSTGDVATYNAGGGIVGGYATYLTAANFTVEANTGYQLNDVIATDANGNDVALIEGENNSYTIAGTDITSDITITVDTDSTSKLTFTLATDCTDMATGGAYTATVLNQNTGDEIDGKLSDEQIESIEAIEATANDGYKFVEWQDADGTEVTLADIVATKDATYYAVFENDSYTVTFDNSISGIDADATHGTAFTFTPSIDGSFIYGVYAEIGTGNETQLPANADGSYTIDGDLIVGDITITVDSFLGSISYITNTEYLALEAYTQILMLTTDKLTESQWSLDDKVFYWSSKYGDNGAYVQIVADDAYTEKSDAQIAALFSLSDSTTIATEIAYGGDLNSNDTVSSIDGSMVNDLIKQFETSYTITDDIRFEADVNGNQKVSTDDINWILNMAVGITNE